MTDTSNRDQQFDIAAKRWFGSASAKISHRERRVLEKARARETVARDASITFDSDLTFGQRMADRVAIFGGSWTFILIFGGVLITWVSVNVVLATQAFDPYPFIFLNLILSMLAAVQAPIIMMSQNRQGVKDRIAAAHDYEVNLKAEIEIMALHDKFDRLRTEHLEKLLERQQVQIEMLARAFPLPAQSQKDP